MMIVEAIHELINGNNLSFEMAETVMDEIMSGKATNAQMGSYLTALRIKGETTLEITACAKVMRNHCTKLIPERDAMDIVGTGGDEANTFNISTIASFVVAAAGIPVAKHGNRSVSSKCGSADLLEALGVKIDLDAAQNKKVLDALNICFMFAPTFHASMKYAAPVRKELKARTIFNILGPLANPAGASLQLLGVYDENLVEPLAKVLANLGVKRAMAVHGQDGLDEVSLCAPTTICKVNDGQFNTFTFEPQQLGFETCAPADLVGGGPAENAQIALEILDGKKGPKRDVVLLNAALCLSIGKSDLTLPECVQYAAELIDSGKAKQKLNDFVAMTNEVVA